MGLLVDTQLYSVGLVFEVGGVLDEVEMPWSEFGSLLHW